MMVDNNSGYIMGPKVQYRAYKSLSSVSCTQIIILIIMLFLNFVSKIKGSAG